MRDVLEFSRQFLFHPITVSSIAPSSKTLSSIMVDKAELRNAKVVLEFGCGNGVITEDIVSNLSSEAIFITFDINRVFTEIVKEKFPNAIVINDSVENVEKYMKQYCINKVDAIISSLPWTAFNREKQIKLLKIIYRILNPGGVFITYSYVHTFVLPSQIRFRKILRKIFKETRISNIVWANIPPAVVIKCKRYIRGNIYV